MTSLLPHSPTTSQRFAIIQSFKIENAISNFRSEKEYRLAKFYLAASALLYFVVILFTGSTLLQINISWVESAFVLVIFLIFLVVVALFIERIVLDNILSWHLKKRYSSKRCWEQILHRDGGIGAFPAQMIYTEHPLAINQVRIYLEQLNFTKRDQEAAEVIINDDTLLTLAEMVNTVISLR